MANKPSHNAYVHSMMPTGKGNQKVPVRTYAGSVFSHQGRDNNTYLTTAMNYVPLNGKYMLRKTRGTAQLDVSNRTLAVYHVLKVRERTYWNRIGFATPHKDGYGHSVELFSMPVNQNPNQRFDMVIFEDRDLREAREAAEREAIAAEASLSDEDYMPPEIIPDQAQHELPDMA